MRYLAAVGASLLVHGSLMALLLLVTTRDALTERGAALGKMTSVAVVEVPLDEPPPAFERKEDEGVAAAELVLAGFTFNMDKIARRRSRLFPLIREDVAVDALARVAEDFARQPLRNPLVRAGARKGPALSLSAEAVQRVVDRAWSRSERWDAFREIGALVDRFDPDDETLALILRRYVDENLLQPFEEVSTPDPRLWVELTVAADFDEFLDFIAAYVRMNSGTKAATELLFLLDELVQANQDALVTLLRRTPEDLQLTRTANPEAFELVTAIRKASQEAVAVAGLSSATDVAGRYDSVRLMVLSTILATTPDGYRADDARYLAGEIHWRAGRPDEAVRVWRQMNPDLQDTYQVAAMRVQDAIASTPPNQVRVTQALRDQNGRWWVFSSARLRQFGYRPDRY
jgi:hypothetical protein